MNSSENMKLCILISCLTFVCCIAFPQGEKYKSQYEDMDVEAILKSSRLLKNYVDCLMDRGNCPPPAKDLKEHLGDALETDCSKCSEKQKTIGSRAIEFLMESKPDIWTELQGKYDPEGIFTTKWQARIKSKNGAETPPTE